MKAWAFFLLLLMVPLGRAENPEGWLQPYRAPGTYSLGDGRSDIRILQTDSGKWTYRISVRVSESHTKTSGGGEDFIKDRSRFFAFPENVSSYWVYDGQAQIVHVVFQEHAIRTESFTAHGNDCFPRSMRGMPPAFLALLPPDIQDAIRHAKRT